MDVDTTLNYGYWIKKHSRLLSKCSGQWIALRPNGKFVGHSDDAKKLFLLAKKDHPNEIPFIYKVPRPDEGPYVL